MFPLEKFTIYSSLAPDLVREKLLDVVEPRKTFRWHRRHPDKPYQGEIGEHSFEMMRIINYRNSFLPLIKGRISSEPIGSKIEVEMSLHPVVFVFMLVWLGMVGQFGVLLLIATIAEGTFEPAALIPVGMFIFGCLLPLIGFKPEAGRSKKFLQQLLQTDE
jgi:hypothetical protein